MVTLAHLPALNAVLDGLSVALVALGWWAVRRQQELAHAGLLSVATVVSTASLAGEGAVIGRQVALVQAYPGPSGWVCAGLLVAHSVAALAWTVLVTAAYLPVWRGQWNVHRRVGKLAMPVWLFVALTGVMVNVVLLVRGRD